MSFDEEVRKAHGLVLVCHRSQVVASQWGMPGGGGNKASAGGPPKKPPKSMPAPKERSDVLPAMKARLAQAMTFSEACAAERKGGGKK